MSHLIAAGSGGNAALGGLELLGIIGLIIFLIWCFKR